MGKFLLSTVMYELYVRHRKKSVVGCDAADLLKPKCDIAVELVYDLFLFIIFSSFGRF